METLGSEEELTFSFSTSTSSLTTPSTLSVVSVPRSEKSEFLDDELSLDRLNKIRLETFINRLNLSLYNFLSDAERKRRLDHFDAVEIYESIEEILFEINDLKLENHVIEDYLMKNDSKLLVGIDLRRSSLTQEALRRRSQTSLSNKSLTLSKQSLTRSIGTRSITGRSNKKPTDLTINFRGKIELTEKLSNDVERQIANEQAAGAARLRVLMTKVEQLEMELADQLQVLHTFRVNFTQDPKDIKFLINSHEEPIRQKFIKFVKSFQLNAQLLLGTMRLRISSLKESCASLRADVITKSDLCNVIGAIDFEQLVIQCNMLLRSLDDKQRQMHELKTIAGNAAISMAHERGVMMIVEGEYRRIVGKTQEVESAIEKLIIEEEECIERNIYERQRLKDLRTLTRRFKAPSIGDYMELKEKFISVDREEKALERKYQIVIMKYENIVRQCEANKRIKENKAKRKKKKDDME